MKILFLSRATLFSQPGGDTLQVEQTAHYLRELGCEVEIATTEVPKAANFDLIHFFNLIRPADARMAFKTNKPVVVSSIYHDYSEYDQKHRKGLSRSVARTFGKFRTEYLKTLGRWINGSDRFPGMTYLLRGQKASIKKLLKRASFVVATSRQELDLIRKEIGFLPESRKVALGSEHMPEKGETISRQGVLCAARIEGPKNQLKLIKALKGAQIPLTLTGKAATNQSKYLEACKNLAGPEVTFAGRVSDEKLTELFQQARVHALISYYETTGLSTLEALKLGCQAVITDRGAQAEIFKNHAFYCDPDNVQSIRMAIDEAMHSHKDHSEWVKENFSWAKAAHEILDIYQTVIHNQQE